MKKVIYAALALGLATTLPGFAQSAGTAAPATAQADAAKSGLNWLDNSAQVLELAKKENKPILINFTGSDWCGWCIRLKKEVFHTPEFEAFAKDNLILQVADFPRKVPQTAELKAQNTALAEKYGVQGFPTLVILNSDGQQIGQMGYMRGGPGPFIAKLKQVIGK